MSSVVRRLSESLSNQIAAGEVVERPASAAKELVENALDAGARRVSVVLEDGGRRRIEVVDDGRGMSREDALLALDRHTTSKLRTSDDLFDIRTYGFRGEALPSIASVSRFTLTTRSADALAATRIVVEGGRVGSVEEVGAPVGTRVEVEDLFFNVPARLKFLKTRATELGHVTEWLSRLALARTDVAFTLAEGARTVLKAEATDNGRERIAAVLGRDLYDALYPVDGTHGDVRVQGFAAGPQRQNQNAREILTFVNGRFVRDRGLIHAVARAYDGVLQIGRSPAVVLFIEVPPSRVDVNVHPQKLEVRFQDARSVGDAVVRTLGTMLQSSPWLAATPATRPARTYQLRPVSEEASAPVTPEPPRPKLQLTSPEAPFTPQQQRIFDTLQRWAPRPPTGPERAMPVSDVVRPLDPIAPTTISSTASALTESAPTESAPTVTPPTPAAPTALVRPVDPEETPAAATTLRFSELRYLGQVHRTYLVCEAPEGLVLLDQHAAHERVLYERYRRERAGTGKRGQPLLVPMTLDFAPADARAIEAALEELAAVGFELEPFGGTTFAVQACPPELEGSDLARTIADLAHEIREHGRGRGADVLETSLLVRMSCHAAVRKGDPMTPDEVRALLEQLDGTPFHAQCPHGRPVVVRFDVDALEQMFARTYEGTSRTAARDRLTR